MGYLENGSENSEDFEHLENPIIRRIVREKIRPPLYRHSEPLWKVQYRLSVVSCLQRPASRSGLRYICVTRKFSTRTNWAVLVGVVYSLETVRSTCVLTPSCCQMTNSSIALPPSLSLLGMRELRILLWILRRGYGDLYYVSSRSGNRIGREMGGATNNEDNEPKN